MNKTRRISLVLVCVVAIAILGLFVIRNLIDFPVYYAAGRSLIQGRTDLYSPDFAVGRVMDYRYPPFFLIALFPFWLIPYRVAAYIWYLLSVLEIAGCALIITKVFPKLRERKKMWLPVALAVAQYFVMVLHYGNAQLLATWYRHVVSSQEFHEDNGPINLSLKGQLRRYLTDVDYSQRVDGDVDYAAVNLGSVSREHAVELWAVIAGILFSGVMFLIWWARQGFGRGANSLELALMICLILMIGPLTSKIYFIALLWPVASLVSLAADTTTRMGKVVFVVLALLAATNFVLPLLPGRSTQRLLLVVGVDFYLNCLLMATLIYSLVWFGRGLQATIDALQTLARSEARTP